jgi:hypothetical protein
MNVVSVVLLKDFIAIGFHFFMVGSSPYDVLSVHFKVPNVVVE